MDSSSNSAHQRTLILEAPREIVGNRWEILEPLADGGMGRLFIARHVRTGKRAALKILERDDPEAKARFRLEARISAELNHPGLVDVFDADVDERTGRCFMAMELLEGHTLREAMDDTTQTPSSLLALLMKVLDPLTVAHARGYVHRDLKPENIFVTGQGAEPQVKLLDFGIAGHELRKGLTMVGTAMGTPHYMSPEQAMDAAEAQPSSDVWSMGVLLYEALCGHVPFTGDTAHAVVVRVCTESPEPLDREAPGVSPELAALVMRCLSKDPEDRPQNGGELLQALRVLHRPNSIPAHRIPQHPSLPGEPRVSSSVRTRDGFHPTISQSMIPRAPVHIGMSLAGATVLSFALMGRITGDMGDGLLLGMGVVGAALALSGLALTPRNRLRARKSMLELPPTIRPRWERKTEDGLAAPLPLVRGTDEALVRVQVYTDLCSTAARRLAERAADLQRAHPQEVRLEMTLLPSGTSSEFTPMGEIVEELRTRNGVSAAWLFVDDLLTVRKRLTDSMVMDFAERAGVHMVSLRHALRVKIHGPKVEKLRRDCVHAGITQTPTVLVQGIAVGDVSPAGVSRAVERALSAAREARDQQTGVASTRMAVPQGTPAQMELRRILVCFAGAQEAPKAVRRSREQARERAEKLRARACMPGANFADVAMRFGDTDIDLGTVELESLPEAMVQAIARLRVGEISPLFESREGFSIVQRIR